jgi:mono/diheme cytochrome c family protein
MDAPWGAEWLNGLIGGLQAGQVALLRMLAGLGLVDAVHGQPAWPWGARLSGENLLIDAGQARRLGVAAAVLAGAVAVLLLAVVWRRRRWPLAAVAVLMLLAAPWPEGRVLAVAATPASFHASPGGFDVASIARGRALFAAHCTACHGADGRGQGPLAAAQPVWPPDLAGPLLWRRADGDLLWHVLHGMRDRHGAPSMPGFGDRLRDDEAWALIDFMKAQAAGEGLRATGAWALPVALPDAGVRCDGRPARPLSRWRGQRIRVVAEADARSAPPLEDPRFVTVRLRPGPAPAGSADGPGAPDAAGCVIDDPDAWAAFSLVAGTASLAGTRLVADRGGWLRALNRPGAGDWSDEDLLCRTPSASTASRAGAVGDARAAPASSTDGLDALIRRMEAEPVRFVKGGFVH